MSEFRNSVAYTTTTTGTGTITLGSAIAQYFALVAGDDGSTFDYRLVDADGTDHEVGRGVYTHSGTTLTRVVERSTNSDSAINLSSGTHTVFLTEAASTFDAMYLPQTSISPTTGNITATLNRTHRADLSGLTANRNFVIPAGKVGDRVSLFVVTGDPDYEFLIIGDTGISINGGTAATEWSRVFIAKEKVTLVASSATNWDIEHDGRIKCRCDIYGSWTHTTVGYEVFDMASATTEVDVGDLADTANDQMVLRRDGDYEASVMTWLNASGVNRTAAKLRIDTVDVTTSKIPVSHSGAAGAVTAAMTFHLQGLSATDAIDLYMYQNDSTSEVVVAAIGLVEQLR